MADAKKRHALLMQARASYMELDRVLDLLEDELRPAFADDLRHVRRNIGEEIDQVSKIAQGQRTYEREEEEAGAASGGCAVGERETNPRVCSMTIEAEVSGQPARVRTIATGDSRSTSIQQRSGAQA